MEEYQSGRTGVVLKTTCPRGHGGSSPSSSAIFHPSFNLRDTEMSMSRLKKVLQFVSLSERCFQNHNNITHNENWVFEGTMELKN